MAMSPERLEKLMRECLRSLAGPYPLPEPEVLRAKEAKAADAMLAECLRKGKPCS